MYFNLETLDSATSYKLLAATVVPRPIAWTVTRNRQGVVNAAPFSFFNVMGSKPPVVALGILADAERGMKDTARNIVDTGEFVVNLVPVGLVEKMNLTAIDAPIGVDELALAGVKTTSSTKVAPPRIISSPVALECVNQASVVTGPNQTLIIGRVVAMHIDDKYVLDANRGHIDTIGLDLAARTVGAGYARISDPFDLARPTWKDREQLKGMLLFP